MGLEKLFDKLFEYIALLKFWYKVMPYERAVLYLGGKCLGERGPGFHPKLPFNWMEEKVISVAVDTFNTMAHEYLTRDGVSVAAGCTVVWRVADVVKFQNEIEDGDGAITDLVFPALAEVMKGVTWTELLDLEPGDISDRVAAAVKRRRPGRWGIEVLTISLSELGRVRGIRLWQS